MQNILPRSDIPNTRGFRFTGIHADGTEEICTVVTRPDGSHTLANDAWPRIVSWRSIPAGEITPRPFLQVSFRDAGGVLVQSFALIRQREDGRAEAIAVADCEDGKIVRFMSNYAPELFRERYPIECAFRSAVCAILAAGPAAPFRSYGPEFVWA